MPNVKKYHLESDKSSSTLIFGILCDEKEYKLSWLLNEKFGIKLTLTKNFQWTHKKLPTMLEFACYTDETFTPEPIFLIRSKTISGHALSEFGQFDYILVFGKSDKEWTNQLRDIREVRGVFELDPSSLQNIDLL